MISKKGKMKKWSGHYCLKYSTYCFSQHCPNSPSQLELLQMLSLQLSAARLVSAKRQLCSVFCSKNNRCHQKSPISASAPESKCIYFFLHLQRYMQVFRDWKKAFCRFTNLDKPSSLQRSEGNCLCIKTLWKELLNKSPSLSRTRHRSVLALLWEQFASLLALKSRVSLGTDACTCPLSVTCSSSHLTQKFQHAGSFCSANEPHFRSTFSHLPNYNFGLSIFSHSWKKHPIVSLFCCGSAESQVWPAAIKSTASRDHTRQRENSWREDKSHCGPWSFPFHGTEETHRN